MTVVGCIVWGVGCRRGDAVMDGDTGEVLVGGSHTVRRPIASLTKVSDPSLLLKGFGGPRV